jgi:hypothetical protein
MKKYKELNIETDWESINPFYEKLMQIPPGRNYKNILKTEDVFYLEGKKLMKHK